MRLRFVGDAGNVITLTGVIGVVGLVGLLEVVVFGELGLEVYVVLGFLLRVTREVVEETSTARLNNFRPILRFCGQIWSALCTGL